MEDEEVPEPPVISESRRVLSIRGSVMPVLRAVSVEPIMFIYMICLYYLIPAANSLYLYKVCRTVHKFDRQLCIDLVEANITTNNSAQEHLVSTDTASYLFYQTIVFTIPSTLITLIYGIYGDQKGRQIPLLSPFIGQACGCINYLVVSSIDTAHANFLLMGAFLTGISGGFATIIMSSLSHISTEATGGYRTIRLVVLQAVMGIGTMTGSFTVGLLVNTPANPITGWQRTFGMIIALSALGVIYNVLFFKFRSNTRSPDLTVNEARTRYSSINVVQVLSTAWQGFPCVLQLVFVAIWFMWVNGLGEFDVLYSYAQRMGFDTSIYGYFNGFNAGVQAITGAVAILLFRKILHLPDAIIAIIGMTSGGLELLCLGVSGFVPNYHTVFLALWWISPVAGMFKIMGPASMRSIASNLVAKSDQSKLFAFISASDGILQLATSGLYNKGLWKLTEKNYPSMSFFVSLIFITIAIILTVIIHFRLRRRQNDGQEVLLVYEADATPE